MESNLKINEPTEKLSEFEETLIDYNLSLSYEKRAYQHDHALEVYLELAKQG